VYRSAGLKSRALIQLRKALELDPGNKKAEVEFDEISRG
jgi:hypothetical protein